MFSGPVIARRSNLLEKRISKFVLSTTEDLASYPTAFYTVSLLFGLTEKVTGQPASSSAC